MRELIYYIASTLDGFIAHEDGSFDGFPWDDEYGKYVFDTFPETIPAHLWKTKAEPIENKWFDAVLMGRKTYEVGLNEGYTNPYPTLDQYLFSKSMKASPDENVQLIRRNAIEQVKELKQKPGKAIWLCGGSNLASQLFEETMIDKLIVKLNPVLFGSGIPLFSESIKQTALELYDKKIFKSGHVILYYTIQR